jgi:hypothetical protein
LSALTRSPVRGQDPSTPPPCSRLLQLDLRRAAATMSAMISAKTANHGAIEVMLVRTGGLDTTVIVPATTTPTSVAIKVNTCVIAMTLVARSMARARNAARPFHQITPESVMAGPASWSFNK